MRNDVIALMKPVWTGNTVIDEQILFAPDPVTGEILPCRLLYDPVEIVSIRSYYLNQTYHEGIDYEIKDGKIYRMGNGSIPAFSYDEFYLTEPSSIPISSVQAANRYVRYEENGLETYRRAVYVTYVHSGKWPFLIENKAEEKLPQTLQKLKENQELHILFYGDSIACGCDSSGRTGIAPFYPTYDRLIVEKLSQMYHSKIRFTNTAVGGTVSEWGIQELEERVLKYQPDLIYIRFGMNDGSTKVPAEVYVKNMKTLVQNCRERLPKAEFILMGTELPNQDCAGWTGTQREYEEAMQWVENEEGCAYLKIMDIFNWIVDRKGYPSIAANFVNHPNDFLNRIYAQLICKELGIME